jgi:acyl dehydratase
MNHYTYEELEIGHEESFLYELNEEKMEAFKMITGDWNPLHNDLSFATEKGYSEKVVYGMLTISALSTLAGVYLPGEKSLIHSIESSFTNPVFLSNCPLKVTGKIMEKDDRFKQITIKYTIIDQKDTKVSRGKMKIGFLD